MKDTGGGSGFSFYAGASTALMWIWIVIVVVVLLSLWLIGIFSGILRVNGWTQSYVAVAPSPGGTEIVFTGAGRGSTDLYRMDLRDRGVRRVTQTSLLEEKPAYCPDGRSILFSAIGRPGDGIHIYRCNLDGKGVSQITTGRWGDKDACLSPDGTRITFRRAHRFAIVGHAIFPHWHFWDIYVGNADGTGIRRLTEQNYYQVSAPRFSADGRSIIFSAYASGETFIYSIDAAGGRPPDALAKGWMPCPSPDGKWIAFISDRQIPYEYEIWLMRPDGSGLRQLTRTGLYKQFSVFMPDSQHVLFLSIPTRKFEHAYDLWSASLDGREPRLVADHTLFDHPMRWRRGGARSLDRR